MSDREQLKKIILELSYEKRLVTLASGRQSDFYFDGKQTTLHAEGAFWSASCSMKPSRTLKESRQLAALHLVPTRSPRRLRLLLISTARAFMPSLSGRSRKGTAPASGWKGAKIFLPERGLSLWKMSSPPAAHR